MIKTRCTSLLSEKSCAIGAQSGFALIAAIAIMVILAALGGFILSVTVLRDQSAGLDILGTRALNVARAGIEWGMYQIQNPEDTGGAALIDCPVATFPRNFAKTTFDGAQGSFAVRVTCALTNAANPVESGNTIRIFQLTAVACNDPLAGNVCPNNNAIVSPVYAERSITVLTETCRTPSNTVC
jgi:MSHA biogenesis protein MshP